MSICQAGPLFTEGERIWQKSFQAELEKAGFLVSWPGDLLSNDQITNAGADAPNLIFGVCKSALERCDCVVALLDGAQVDDGTAWQLGYAHAVGLPVFGIRTDSRQAGETKYGWVNAMIQGCLTGFGSTAREIILMLRRVEIDRANGHDTKEN